MPLRLKRLLIKILIALFRLGFWLKYFFLYALKIAATPLRLLYRASLKPILVFSYALMLKAKRTTIHSFFRKNSLIFFLSHRNVIHILLFILAFFVLGNNVLGRDNQYTEKGNLPDKTLLSRLLPPTDYEEEVLFSMPIFEGPETLAPLEEPIAPPSEEEISDQQLVEEGIIIAPALLTTTLGQARKETISYTVESGDTISTIAEKFQVSQNTILWENKLASHSIIRPGQVLQILPTTGVTHKIIKGDTIKKIAQRYKADEEKIRDFNQLEDDKLIIGQNIIVPDGKIQIYQAPSRVAVTVPQRAPVSSITSSGEAMLWPSPVRRINQYFNWRHFGLDIDGEIGTPIRATLAGTVVSAGWSGDYGLAVVINHGGGLVTRYAHNSKLLVSRGEKIEKGQTVALGGSTGRSTGPHLHFEVIVNGKRVNPLHYIK